MMNSITIMGRLCKSPELKSTRDGVAVCSVSVAVDRDYTGSHGEKQTDFFEVVAWRGTAEFISRYFTKGQQIAVQGEMQSRKYTDKNGNKRTAWELIANRVWFCGDKRPADDDDDSRDGQSPYFDGRGGADFSELPDDDLPFDV